MSQSFLIVAADPIIESLVGELVSFAGHRPAYLRDDEGGAGAIRKRPPFGVLIDASDRPTDVDAAVRAARELHVVVVYFASCMSSGELRAFAEARRTMWFALPNGPNLVSRVLDDAIAAGPNQDEIVLDRSAAEEPEPPLEHPSAYNPRTSAPAITAALVALQRAQRLMSEVRLLREENRLLRTETVQLRSEATTNHLALRDAVRRFATSLRNSGVSADVARSKVKTLLFESAVSVTDERTAADVAHAAIDWVSEVYAA